MTDDEWAFWEQSYVDRVRVRGYALACCNAVGLAKRNVEAATERLLRAQKDAEHALRRLRSALEQAELAARVAESGDDAWVADVAVHLEEAFG